LVAVLSAMDCDSDNAIGLLVPFMGAIASILEDDVKHTLEEINRKLYDITENIRKNLNVLKNELFGKVQEILKAGQAWKVGQ